MLGSSGEDALPNVGWKDNGARPSDDVDEANSLPVVLIQGGISNGEPMCSEVANQEEDSDTTDIVLLVVGNM